MPKRLCRLVYRSHSNIPHDDTPGLTAIFRASIRNNRRDRITGALALPDGKFVQVIEGSNGKIDDLMVRLVADDRHSEVTVLGRWPINDRLFAAWAMARPDPTPLSAQAFRIVTEDGSGAQVTGLLLGLTDQPKSSLFGF